MWIGVVLKFLNRLDFGDNENDSAFSMTHSKTPFHYISFNETTSSFWLLICILYEWHSEIRCVLYCLSAKRKNKGYCDENWSIRIVHSALVFHVIRKNTNETLITNVQPFRVNVRSSNWVVWLSFCRLMAFHKSSFKFNVSLTGWWFEHNTWKISVYSIQIYKLFCGRLPNCK